MRKIIISVGLLGAILFGVALIASYVRPLFVESMAREIIRHEVEKRVGEKISSLSGGKLAELAEKIARKNALEIDAVKRKLRDDLPKKIAAIVAEMGNPSCDCRKWVEHAISDGFESKILNLGMVNEHLASLIRAKYMDVSHSLTSEFRVFTTAHALVFALLAISAFFRRNAGVQLLLPTIVLLGASIIVGGFYLFGQNWLHTILFSDYVGLWYFAYLAAAIAFLSDVVFNRAKISTRIINMVSSAIGGAFAVTPC